MTSLEAFVESETNKNSRRKRRKDLTEKFTTVKRSKTKMTARKNKEINQRVCKITVIPKLNCKFCAQLSTHVFI